MSKRWYGRAASVSLIILGCALAAQATPTTYLFTTTGADALITVDTNEIIITLYDLYINPNDVSDNLSAFYFTTSGSTSGAAVSTSSADSISIAGNGTHTDNGSVAPSWALTEAGAVTKLDDLVGTGHAGPANTIVGAPDGSGIYSNGGGSIDDAPSHNPFLNQTATWTLTETGITAATIISAVNFQFGTTEGAGVKTGTLVPTPEPASAGLFILGGISLLLIGRKSLLRSR